MTRYYSSEHEWIERESADRIRVGISSYAREQLGEVVFVNVPAVGTKMTAGEEIGVIESVKSASELYAPLSGEVVARNDDLDTDTTPLNDDPEQDGWLFVMQPSDPGELENLMSAEDYRRYTGQG